MVGRRKSNLHLPPRMYQKHGAYYYVTKSNKWIRLSDNLAQAKAKWIELEGEVPQTDTVAALIERYLQEVAPKKAPRTYRDNLTEAKTLLAVFGSMRPGDVRPMHVAQYLDVRGKKAPVRANREKSLLSHVFSMAMRWGVVDSNPCRGVARNTEKGRDRYINDAEFMAVKQIAGDFIATVMDFAYLTALRKGDIFALRLEQITAEGIYIKQGKTGMKQIFEWTPTLREVIARARALPRPIRGLYLFCTRRGQPYTDAGFKAMWNRIQVKWAESGGERFTFHDIRAKSLTDAKQQGLDAQALAGHASSATTDHYIKMKEFRKVTPLH